MCPTDWLRSPRCLPQDGDRSSPTWPSCEVIVGFQKACNQVHMLLKRLLSRPLVLCAVALMLWLVCEPPALSCFALCAKPLVYWLVPRKPSRFVCRARVIGSRRFCTRRCQFCGDWVRVYSLADVASFVRHSRNDSVRGQRSCSRFASNSSCGNCFVKTLNGCTLVVPLHASSCSRDIAVFVSDKTAVPVKFFYLALAGRVLRQGSFCADVGVQRDCHIMMDSAPAFDPWAAYASASRQPDDDVEMPEVSEPDARRATTAAQVVRPARAKWEELQVAGDHSSSLRSRICLTQTCASGLTAFCFGASRATPKLVAGYQFQESCSCCPRSWRQRL